MTITRNTAIDMYRKRQKQPISSEEIEMEIAPFAPSTEEIFFDRVSVTDLAAAISQLDQKYKDVLRLYYINELSSKETRRAFKSQPVYREFAASKGQREAWKDYKGEGGRRVKTREKRDKMLLTLALFRAAGNRTRS